MTELIVGVTENLTMTSLEIAELTWKTHSNVLKDIERMFNDLEMPKESQVFYYFAEQSQTGEMRRYKLDYDLTMTLITWYSTKLRISIIKRWKELENVKPQTFEQIMQNALLLADQRVKLLEAKIEEDKPITDFGRAISQSIGTCKIWDWIKAINDSWDIRLWRNKAFKWFRDKWYLTQDNRPMQQYVNQGLFELKEWQVVTDIKTIQTFTTLLTGKGQMYFAKKLKEYYE